MSSPCDLLPCTAIREQLEAFIDGELAPESARAVTAHVAVCAACERERERALAVRDGLRSLPQWDAPDRVLAAVRREVSRRPVRRPRRAVLTTWPARLAAAAALVVAAAGATLWWHQARSPAIRVPDAAALVQASGEARYALAVLARATRRGGVDAGRRALVDHLIRPVVAVMEPTTTAPARPSTTAGAEVSALQGGR